MTAHGWYIDDVTIGTSCDATPLAVELSSFTALEEFDGVTLGWETVSERGTAGFRLYRGTAPTGPWLYYVTSSLIPSTTPGRGTRQPLHLEETPVEERAKLRGTCWKRCHWKAHLSDMALCTFATSCAKRSDSN